MPAIVLSLLAATVAAPDLPTPNVDMDGDALPPGAVARLGHARHRTLNVPFAFPAARSATFTADGKHVATLVGNDRAAFWDVPTGKMTREVWLTLPSEARAFRGIRLANDASTATADIEVGGRPASVMWDLATGRAKVGPPPPPPPPVGPGGKPVLDSPDGRYRLSGTERGTADVVWQLTNVSTGKDLWPDPPKETGLASFGQLAFTPDGKYLVGCRQEARQGVFAWEVATSRQALYVDTKANPASVASGPDGAVIVWGGLEVFTPGQPTVYHTQDLTTNVRTDAAAAAEQIGGWLQAGRRLRGPAASMIEQDIRTALKLAAPKPESRMVVAPVLEAAEKQRIFSDGTADGKYLVWFGEPPATDRGQYNPRKFPEAVSVWDLTTGKLVGRHVEETNRLVERGTGPGGVSAYDFGQARNRIVGISPDGKRVILLGVDGVRVWEPGSGKPPAVRFTDSWTLGALSATRSTALSPDGTRLATALFDGQILIWDVSAK